MSKFELYVFFLCLIVFTALTVLFTVFVVWLVKLMIKLIRHGAEDEAIKKEYYKSQCSCGKTCFSEIFDKIISAVFCILFLGIFIFSLSLNLSEEKKVGDIPVMRVVQSGSMAKKYEKNKYLFENNLNDQIQTFDIIVTEKLPDEMDLELYDIVVYEVDDTLVVHRIVKIEEPNASHPDCRWFTLQGDNVQYPDKTPVLYSQMRAVYNGQRIPFIGSFVSFMQSPAGYLCILLIVFGSIAIPVVEKILEKEREKRLIAIGELPAEGELFSDWQAVSTPESEPTKAAIEPAPVLELSESKAITGLSAAYAESSFAPTVSERFEELTPSVIESREEISSPVVAEYVENTESIDEIENNEIAALKESILQTPPTSLEELLAKGYSIKNIRVKLLKKQQAFAGNKSKLLKLAEKGDTLQIYLGFNVKEKVENYTLVNIPSERMRKVAPAQMRITLKREKRGEEQ